jgi:hypothetical protein
LSVTALLASTLAIIPSTCTHPAASLQTTSATPAVHHAFQNGDRLPLRLFWIDPQGKRVDQGVIAPGAYVSIQTFAGHVFTLTDTTGRCQKVVRVGDGLAGTYVGTSRYRAVAIRPGWQVFNDQALDPATEPAQSALASIARMLQQVEASLPAVALKQVRKTPIFLLEHAGPNGMFHPDPDWLVTHGRTVEMLNGIEISDASVFIETSKVQPGAILHELSHAYYIQLPDKERAQIDTAYKQAMESVGYRQVKRHDGSVTDAYARSNAAEYFAELTEAHFSRNDFYPFTRSDLATYDPNGERLIAKLWR